MFGMRNYLLSVKHKMTQDKKELKYLAIQSLFLKGTIKRMSDIIKLDPTMVSRDFPMNHSRYVKKLYQPELFTIKQVKRLAEMLEIKPQLIVEIILKQPSSLKPSQKKKK